MNLFARKNLYLTLLLIAVVDALIIYRLASLNNSDQIYFRNILFSQIISDSDLSPVVSLDSLLTKDFKLEVNPNDFGPYLNPNLVSTLSKLQKDQKSTDRELAYGIVAGLGESPSGQVCGVPSLGKVVFDVENGVGCCSDYTKAWIFYASYLGLQAREVNTLGHNTVEYFDRQLNHWSWIDPYHRIEILGLDGMPMDQASMRKKSLFEALNFKRLPGSSEVFDIKQYSGYSPSELSILMWRKGTNFLTVEKWDSHLRNLHVPKVFRQFILLSSGIAPHWVMLTTDPVAIYFRTLQNLLYLVGAILVLLNMYLLGAILYLLLDRYSLANTQKHAGG